jgi:deoxyribodipyrimidine photo-lyase
MQIVWFKRDLRVHDNAVLWNAANNGPFIPLYILEPELWALPDMSYRQFSLLTECLIELDQELANLGQRLIIKVGNAVDILQDLNKRYNIKAVWSHQETWNWWTYQRDLSVSKFLKSQNIPWHEPAQNGVIRRLKDRSIWPSKWYEHVGANIIPPPKSIGKIDEASDNLPTLATLGLVEDGCYKRQKGGRTYAVRLLNSFLSTRGQNYNKSISSPLTAFTECSRLSPYLAFGSISIREVFRATETRINAIKLMPPSKESYQWLRSLERFKDRLRWHCHFMQKLEDEPEIEFKNMHNAYDSIRSDSFDQAKFEAWASGKTGYPMIDACMRALHATGWINFRMRAMLISFASCHLWLDWRHTAHHLARLFVDYEPGIHYSQCQMQSGTTGINTLRIYNPIKQSMDQDPEGIFIKRWIPELSEVPLCYIHEPWKSNLELLYPKPIVDEKEARKFASERLYGLRKQAEHKEGAQAVLQKHTIPSKNKIKRVTKDKKPLASSRQLSFAIDNITKQV